MRVSGGKVLLGGFIGAGIYFAFFHKPKRAEAAETDDAEGAGVDESTGEITLPEPGERVRIPTPGDLQRGAEEILDRGREVLAPAPEEELEPEPVPEVVEGTLPGEPEIEPGLPDLIRRSPGLPELVTQPQPGDLQGVDVPDLIERGREILAPTPAPAPPVFAPQPPPPTPIVFEPPELRAPTPPQQDDVPDDTALLVASMLEAEGTSSWKRTEPDLADWQAERGLTSDGKLGPGTALKMAEEIGTLPIVRFWPLSAGPQPQRAIDDYRSKLRALARSVSRAHGEALKASALREKGQSFGPPTGNPNAPIADRVFFDILGEES